MAKHIFSSKIISPTSRNARVRLENIVTKNSTINCEEFIAIAQKNNLNKNCVGFCTSAKVNLESIKKHE